MKEKRKKKREKGKERKRWGLKTQLVCIRAWQIDWLFTIVYCSTQVHDMRVNVSTVYAWRAETYGSF